VEEDCLYLFCRAGWREEGPKALWLRLSALPPPQHCCGTAPLQPFRPGYGKLEGSCDAALGLAFCVTAFPS